MHCLGGEKECVAGWYCVCRGVLSIFPIKVKCGYLLMGKESCMLGMMFLCSYRNVIWEKVDDGMLILDDN